MFIAKEADRALAEIPSTADLAVSVVTLAELRTGVLVASDAERGRRLATLERAVGSFEVLGIDAAVAERFADIAAALRQGGRRLGVQDAWIAATALATGAGVVTQDDGFELVPGLEVVRV